MDPNATLLLIETCLTVSYINSRPDYYTAKALRAELREWLSRGGFEPDWAAAPRAARYCGRQ